MDEAESNIANDQSKVGPYLIGMKFNPAPVRGTNVILTDLNPIGGPTEGFGELLVSLISLEESNRILIRAWILTQEIQDKRPLPGATLKNLNY